MTSSENKLERAKEKARIDAMNKYQHRCSCDFSTEKGCIEHEQAMAILIAHMEAAEIEAVLKFKEPKRIKKED